MRQNVARLNYCVDCSLRRVCIGNEIAIRIYFKERPKSPIDFNSTEIYGATWCRYLMTRKGSGQTIEEEFLNVLKKLKDEKKKVISIVTSKSVAERLEKTFKKIKKKRGGVKIETV